jgi:hypothetical protein
MLKSQSLPYLISGMGDNTAGADLINAIQTSTPLSTSSQDFTRLESCFDEDDIATNFNNCIGGTYQLQLRDVQFVKAGFSAPLTVLQDILNNLSGGYNPNININYI